MDDHDKRVSNLILKLNKILAICSSLSKSVDPKVPINLRLARVKSQLDSTVKDLDQLEKDEGDSALADQNRDRLVECKKHLDNIYEQIANLCIRSDDSLLTDHSQLDDEHFSCEDVLNPSPRSSVVSRHLRPLIMVKQEFQS